MLRKIAIAIALLILVLGSFGYFYIQSLKPKYSGDLKLDGLTAQVEVFFDEFGIPHIYAQTEEDAYLALGYVHAQDRLWQMELVRRIAPGRLSEIFGTGTLETDKFFRSIGINEYSKASADRFRITADPGIQLLVNAYLSGINYFMDTGPSPVEFLLLGIDKTHFDLVDVYNTIGYMAFSFAMAHKTEPIVNKIQSLGPDYLKDLDLYSDTSTTIIKSYPKNEDITLISESVSKIMDNLPQPAWIGSNSWVIGPGKTKSGKVVFANDPHIGFGQPAVWYEAHIEAPGLNLYGYHLAGYPFAIIGHTDKIAFGMTMFENDDTDLYREKINPENENQYLYKGNWEEFRIRTEIIPVKDSADFKFIIRESVHGPVITGLVKNLESTDPIAIWWTYTKIQNQLIESTYGLIHSSSLKEFENAASRIHAPGLNIMYGDAEGNIAWWAAAKLVKRPAHVNSKTILEGSEGKDEPIGYYDFKDNPKAINPPWGYVYSANNQPQSLRDGLYPGYYLPEDRARRIIKILEQREEWDVEDVKKMLLDVKSENVPEIISEILENVFFDKNNDLLFSAYERLKNWDGSFPKSSIEPTLYNKLIYNILKKTFSDELGDETFKAFLNTYLFKRSLQKIISADQSVWWDIRGTDPIESRNEIITKAFEDAVGELRKQLGENISEWQWERVHLLEHNHTFSANKSLKKYFNVGPFGVDGNSEVINNLMFNPDSSGMYYVYAGPSTRRIVDFSNVKSNSWSILPTGQSGNPLSKHYKDQAEMYVNGEFRRQWMDRDSILRNCEDKLILTPLVDQ